MFANFIRYKLFIIRRERVMSLIWVAALVLFAIALTAAYPGLFPTQEALQSSAATMNNPPMVAMMGPVYGVESMSSAMAMAQQCLLWFALAAIVMNIFFVNRHTRVDEELGRHEMLASLPVGRLTGSAVTLVCAFGLNLLISVFTAIGILALDIAGTTVAGAFCYAFSIGAQGFLFAAITLLTAQLFSTAHGSTGASFGVMGLFYILRASGDMSGNALSYISPLGLGLKVEAFYTDAFWPILVLFAEAVIIAGIALAVNAKRDVGEGVIPAKKGRAHATRFLQSPLGLAWRLQRRSFLIWGVTFLLLGACYGSVIGELDAFLEGNDMIKQMLIAAGGNSLADAFLPMLSGIMAMLTSIPVIGTMNRLRVEEKRGRMEQIYARAVPRAAMFGCFALIAICETVIFTFLSTIGLYAVSESTGAFSLGTVLGAAFVELPAIFVMVAITALLVGLFPKLIAAVWVLLCYSFMMLYFGRMFDIPEWAARISPFGNIPQLPIEEFSATPIVLLSVIAALLCAVGLAGYRRRDIAT
jgi:ABC-2 type transport system permease protein